MVTTLLVKSNVYLFGTNGFSFKQVANTSGAVIQVSGANICIDSIEIDGNKTNKTVTNHGIGLSLTGTKNITISNCKVHDVGLDGIYAQGDDIKILHNTVYSCKWHWCRSSYQRTH